MPNKLKNLKITSTDLVEQGANPDAHIRLFKGIKKFSNLFKPSKKETNSFSDVKKDAQTFEETLSSELLTDVVNEVYDFCYALADSFSSIINDKELDSSKKSEMLSVSLNDFSSAVSEALPNWGSGEKSGSVVEKLNLSQVNRTEQNLMELENIDPFDKIYKNFINLNCRSHNLAFFPEEEKFLSELEEAKKAHIAEIEDLKKSFEIEKLTSFAKKYEVIGKKAEEIAQKLYNLKKVGDAAAYDDYVSLLDEQIALVEKSGAFSEIGSSHAGNFDVGNEFAKKVTEIAKQGNISIAAAFAKAYEECPEFASKYEMEYGGKNNA